MEKVRGVVSGWLLSLVILTVLLAAAALLSGKHEFLLDHRAWVSKAGLLIAAITAGLIASRRATRKRLFHALAGEGGLLIVCTALLASHGFQGGSYGMLLDIGFMLIGAFAGTLLCGRSGIQRRGKR